MNHGEVRFAHHLRLVLLDCCVLFLLHKGKMNENKIEIKNHTSIIPE
jgi:hypothetical protein